MMYRMFFIIIMQISFLLALSLAACQKDDEMHDLDGVVLLELREHAPDGERKLGLYAETKDGYPCLNFLIDYELTHASDGIHLHFLGVKAPTFCLTALGPAKAFVDFGKLDHGVHQLQFQLNKEHSDGSLLVSETLVELDIAHMQPASLKLKDYEMRRLQDNHAWGYIHAKSTKPDKEMAAFFDDLWEIGAEKESLDPGNYGFFRITKDDWYFFEQKQQYRPQNPFVFQFDEAFDHLCVLADDYSEHFVIVLYDTQGHYHHNQQ